MKKLVLGLLTLFILSCGASKTVRQSEKTLKGNWVLNDITYDIIGELNITFFGDANKACFEGSSWAFIPNNNTGNYTLSSAGCEADPRYFAFTVDEVDATTGLYDFLLKPTDQRGKSDTNRGFRLSLSALTQDTMQWIQRVNFEGRTMTIKMNFVKL